VDYRPYAKVRGQCATEIAPFYRLRQRGHLLALQAQAWAQKVDLGKTEYLSSCGPCHGSDAKGKGALADQLKATPADLTQLAKKNGGVFPINAVYEKIDGRQEVKGTALEICRSGVIDTRLSQ
jgi:mono/diheme cytochrome c family protein